MATFAQRLRELREAKGLTQSDLGRLLNFSKQTISNYENTVSTPDYATLSKIADYFSVSVDYLLGRTDDPHLHSVSASDRAGVSDSIKAELGHGDSSVGDSRPPLPSWLSKLPPDMQKFVEEESKHGWPYLRLARGLKMQDLTAEELKVIVETWQDAKRRYEREFGPRDRRE